MKKEEVKIIFNALGEAEEFAKEVRHYLYEVEKIRPLTEVEIKLLDSTHNVHVHTEDARLLIQEQEKNYTMDIHKIASQKQINMLAFIEDKCEVKFNGNTAKEVYRFIGEWYPRALKMEKIENAIGPMGVTAYKAKKRYNGNDVHGEWEETKNLKDSIAYEKFKGDIIRGRNAAESLIDFETSAQI